MRYVIWAQVRTSEGSLRVRVAELPWDQFPAQQLTERLGKDGFWLPATAGDIYYPPQSIYNVQLVRELPPVEAPKEDTVEQAQHEAEQD